MEARWGWFWVRTAVAVLMFIGGLGVAPAWSADPDALWKIVHDRCVPRQLEDGDPKPCAQVVLDQGGEGYALLKDLNGVAQYLLIPTERITGIEDPTLLRPGTPNFFEAAWRARGFVDAALGRTLPRDGYGLVINSVQGRTQEQFHIHIDCLRADVRREIEAHAGAAGEVWRPFPVPLVGREYMALRVSGEDLGTHDPFKLLAEAEPGAKGEMALHTLVVVGTGAGRSQGFVMLDRRVTKEAGDRGNGTELLDRSCNASTAQRP